MRNHYVKENDYREVLMSIRDNTKSVQTEPDTQKTPPEGAIEYS